MGLLIRTCVFPSGHLAKSSSVHSQWEFPFGFYLGKWEGAPVKSLIVWVVAVLALLVLSNSVSARTNDQRPFWTEQSSYIQGDELYVVGVASHAHSLEEGRQLAFEHARLELLNFAPGANLADDGLTFQTQMTYEELNPDGTVTVFRLLRTPLRRLIGIQAKGTASTAEKARALQQTLRALRHLRRDTNPKPQPLSGEERYVAALSRQIEDRIKERARLACRYIKSDMTTTDVKSILGAPDVDTLHQGFGTWRYGHTEVWFLQDRVAYLHLAHPC